MAVPDGYDLFEYGWPPQNKEWLDGEQVKLHPLYQVFLKKAKEIGFVIDSGGFEESEEVYFNFFLAGIAESSNGRMRVSETRHDGSSPSSAVCRRCGSLLTMSGFCSGYKDPDKGPRVACSFGRHLQSCMRALHDNEDEHCGCPG